MSFERHLKSNHLSNVFQFGYKQFHPKETTLLNVHKHGHRKCHSTNTDFWCNGTWIFLGNSANR